MKIKIKKEIPTSPDVVEVRINGELHELKVGKAIDVSKEVYEVLKNSTVEFEKVKKKEKDKKESK